MPPPSANNQRDIHPKFRTQPSGDTPANTWSDGREQPFFKATTATYLASPAQRFPGQAPVYAAQCPNPNAARFGEATGKNTSHDMYSRHQVTTTTTTTTTAAAAAATTTAAAAAAAAATTTTTTTTTTTRPT